VLSLESGPLQKCSSKAGEIHGDKGFGEPRNRQPKAPTGRRKRESQAHDCFRPQTLIRGNAVRNISFDGVLSFGRVNGLIDRSVHSLPITRLFAGAALRMTLFSATFANAPLLAGKANAATEFFHALSHRSINKHNCRLRLPIHNRVNLIARITAAATLSSGITRYFIR